MAQHSAGSLIDWSGITGIAVCDACGRVSPVFLSDAETREDAATHWKKSHPDELVPEYEKAWDDRLQGAGERGWCAAEDCKLWAGKSKVCSAHFHGMVPRKCSVDHCFNSAEGTYCTGHWQRRQRMGIPMERTIKHERVKAPPRIKPSALICQKRGCEEPRHGKSGRCEPHTKEASAKQRERLRKLRAAAPPAPPKPVPVPVPVPLTEDQKQRRRDAEKLSLATKKLKKQCRAEGCEAVALWERGRCKTHWDADLYLEHLREREAVLRAERGL